MLAFSGVLYLNPAPEAQAYSVEDGDIIELSPVLSNPGETFSVRLWMTSGAYKEGIAMAYDPRLNFISTYTAGDECQFEHTWRYNASNFAGITAPVDVPGYVYAYGQDFGGDCIEHGVSVTFRIMPDTPPAPTFTLSCSPSTQAITAGQTAAFNLTTTAANGFNSAVAFSSSISPSPSSSPTVSFTNNNAVPSSTTTATVSTTNTTPGNSYTITFTGTGGGVTQTCARQLDVTGLPPGFTLAISPTSSSVVKGTNATFSVTPTCTGSFVGPVTNLTASSFYTNLTYSFSSTTVACGQSVTLTVGNTGSIPSNQLSTPQATLPQAITVTGEGN
jgi:hypothetical protein